MSRKMKGLTGMLVSFVLMPAMVIPGLAQKGRGGTVAGSAAARREALLAREADLNNRELILRRLRDEAKAKKPAELELKLALAQIKEDFERIQIVNNTMMRAVSIGEALDYKQISEVAEEINKRAKRLKTNLVILDLEDGKKVQRPQVATDGEQVRTLLLMLNHLIKSFVTSPLFQNLKVTDVRQLAKARQDLADIIELSHSVRKSAEKLKKSSQA